MKISTSHTTHTKSTFTLSTFNRRFIKCLIHYPFKKPIYLNECTWAI